MNSRDRVLKTIGHEEPDRVPLDLGGTVDTGIHLTAYRNLIEFLDKEGIFDEDGKPEYMERITGQAKIHDDIVDLLNIDVRGVTPNSPSGWDLEIKEEGGYKIITDELGMKWVMPPSGHYYDQASDSHPLKSANSLDDIENYPWPDPSDKERINGLKNKIRDMGKNHAVTLSGPFGGPMAMGFRLRGYKQFYLDLADNEEFACSLMDKITDLKIKFWSMALEELGDLIDIIAIEEDLGQQDRTLVSPEMYRNLIKPRHRRLFKYLLRNTDDTTHLFLHSDGSIYDLIPDLIEMGVDILNPIQIGAANMAPEKLKSEFGQDITFWGGGVDTQGVLSFGSPEEVEEDVKKRIEAFAPGGGYVFSTVHNIQPEVPPENIMAMWRTLQEHGQYS